MSGLLIEHRAVPLLGKEDRTVRLVSWSEKVEKGTKTVRDFAHGLRIGGVADGDSPRIYLHWNQFRFRAFLNGLPFKPEQLHFIVWGISVNHKKGRTRVTMPGVGSTKVILWDSNRAFCKENALANVSWLIGMVQLDSKQGPTFYDQVETQAELQEATAVASFRVDNPVKELPKRSERVLIQPPRPPQSGQQLMQDVLLNNVLQQGKVG